MSQLCDLGGLLHQIIQASVLIASPLVPISSVCKTDSVACKFSKQPCASPTLSPCHVSHHLFPLQITSLRSALPFHALVTPLLVPSAGHKLHGNSPHEASIALTLSVSPQRALQELGTQSHNCVVKCVSLVLHETQKKLHSLCP